MVHAAIRTVREFRNRLKPGCVVLCYHRVSDDTDDYWRNAVSVRNFQDHIAHVARRYGVMPLDSLADAIATGRADDRKSIAITFDDGYAVNTVQAADILIRHRAPAAFFLNSAWLDGRQFWWDELVDALDSEPADVIEAHRARFKAQDHHVRADELRALGAGRAAAARPTCRPMDARQIRAVAAEPLFTVGGHTHSHPSLAAVPPERQHTEIVENKRILEGLCGHPITHFAYPFGGTSDFDEVAVDALRTAGFGTAATTVPKAQRWPGDPYRIPRLSVKNWDLRKFQARLEQMWST